MSREIKFRAKRLDNNEFVIGYYLPMVDESRHFIYLPLDYLNEHSRIEIDPKTLGQYTGLKDKNSKELYEGDLIHWVIYDNGYDGKNFNVNKNKIIKEGIGKVYWASDHYKIKGCKKSISSLIFSASKEVVGNIYKKNNDR